MISHAHRAIFVHVPKTGGTSVEAALGHPRGRGAQDHRPVRALRPLSLRHVPALLDPAPLREAGLGRRAMLREMLGLEAPPSRHGPRATAAEWRDYYRFAVVRNPWARVHSWYRNVMRDPAHGVPPCDFPTFLERHADTWALRPQTAWLEDFDGSIPLDRVVRFERLGEEMAEVLSVLGLPADALPHLLDGGEADYRAAYDGASRRLVEARYRDEIERFGYSF